MPRDNPITVISGLDRVKPFADAKSLLEDICKAGLPE